MSIAALALCLCALCAISARAEDRDGEERAVYDGFLVSCPSAPSAGTQGLLRGTRGAPMEPVLGDVYWTQSEEYAQWLLDTGQAAFVEPNYIATLFDSPAPAPDWPRQMLRTDYAEALGMDGTGVRVAVIDSGLDLANPDLQNARIAAGYDYIGETTAMRDDVYHGTKVAQLIAGDDNGLGVTGIAPRCDLVPLRCFSSSSGGDVKTLSRAIVDAATVYQCDVINMSWGIAGQSSVLHQAIQEAYAAGAVLVAASGNVSSSYPQGTLIYPAAYDEVISVGSVDAQGNVASDSIQNGCVTVCAPGKGVGLIPAGGGTESSSGTSFAAPCVSAALALVKQYAPALRGRDCVELLRERAFDIGETGRDAAYGYGLARLDRLFEARWAYLSESAEGAARFSASLLRAGEGYLMLACYNARGQMCGVRVAPLSGGCVSVRWDLPEGAARCAAFFLGADGRPLYEVIVPAMQ